MFTALGLHESLVQGTAKLGFVEPTPIQKAAIPPALEGRDLLASAPTGTGKTAAFLLPMLQRLHGKARGTTRALILTPTRELAGQIEAQLAQLAAGTRMRGAVVVGGVAMGPQVRALRAGVDVLVATPGRLLDHLQYPYTRLDDVEILVLDEADRMLDMGFQPAIKRILEALPKGRQTLFFSATLPPAIVTLAKRMLIEPVAIDLQPKTSAAAGIRQAVYPIAHDDKTGLLLALLGQDSMESALVFTRTKHRANRLARTLESRGVSCAAIHGNRTQSQRTQALSGFRSGRFPRPGGDRHRGARHRRREAEPRGQLRRAAERGGLRPSHRPHGACAGDRRCVDLRLTGRRGGPARHRARARTQHRAPGLRRLRHAGSGRGRAAGRGGSRTGTCEPRRAARTPPHGRARDRGAGWTDTRPALRAARRPCPGRGAALVLTRRGGVRVRHPGAARCSLSAAPRLLCPRAGAS